MIIQKRRSDIAFNIYDYKQVVKAVNKHFKTLQKRSSLDKINENFLHIHKKGFLIEVRQSRNNYSTVYLVDKHNGHRASNGIKFRSNSSIVEGVPKFTHKELDAFHFAKARKGTHKDKAMKELVNFIDRDFRVEKQYEALYNSVEYFVMAVIDTEWTENVEANIRFRDKELHQIKLKLNDLYMNCTYHYKNTVHSLRKIVKSIHIILTRTQNLDFEEIEDELDMIKMYLMKLKKQVKKIIDNNDVDFAADLSKAINKTEKLISGVKQSLYV